MNSIPPLDPDVCYRALVARDSRFDGVFFTAVASTGIYCRPVCPARTPHRRSCSFYVTAAGAESAGFRPCLRCRPELAPGRADFHDTLAQAILSRLQSGALDADSLESLAAEIGLSSRQLRRIVHDQFGVTPIEVAQTQRLLFAKKLLHETSLSMTQVALSAGFGSVRRFNAAFLERYGMAPMALRKTQGKRAASSEQISLRLTYRPPYAWKETLTYLKGRASAGVEAVEDGAYWRTVALDHGSRRESGWIRVSHAEQPGALQVTVAASLSPVLLPLTHGIRALFDLDADPVRIGEDLAHDPNLRGYLARAPGLRVPGAWNRFELALRAVFGQQISVAGATTLSGRFVARFGTPIVTPAAGLTFLAPTSLEVASASVEEIAAVGIPQSRARTIWHLARFANEGGLDFKPGTRLDEAIAQLVTVPGIGPWTAQYVAMRALRHPDAFPAGDLVLRKAAMLLDGADAMPSEAALELRSQAWRPWRAYAAAYLWLSTKPASPAP